MILSIWIVYSITALFFGCDTRSIHNILAEPETELNLYRAFMDEESRVYDGDSLKDIKIILFESRTHEPDRQLFHNIEMINNQMILTTDLRLNGIDTPEIKVSTKLSDHCRNREKTLGYQARDRVEELIGSEFLIRIIGDSKYGEELVEIYIEINGKSKNLNKLLIDEQLAVPYDGGTKIYDWCEHIID